MLSMRILDSILQLKNLSWSKRRDKNEKSAVDEAQLVERSLPTPKVHGLNPVMRKVLLGCQSDYLYSSWAYLCMSWNNLIKLTSSCYFSCGLHIYKFWLDVSFSIPNTGNKDGGFLTFLALESDFFLSFKEFCSPARARWTYFERFG